MTTELQKLCKEIATEFKILPASLGAFIEVESGGSGFAKDTGKILMQKNNLMKLDNNGYKLIQKFEGLKLNAYQDSVGIWTIGFGNITYENGTKVKKGDKISQDRAEQIFSYYADKFARNVDAIITNKNITQNQFNAVVSLAYNIGLANFQKSTLLKKLNTNNNDKTIKDEFLKWVNASGKRSQGLVNRRTEEANLYFKM